MLEKVLEQLLLRFLAPYVEGLSRDRLRFGVWSGEIELRHLSVKPDAPAHLGNHLLRVKTGSVGCLHLSVPWQRLYSGKVAVSVEGLDLELERIVDASAEETPDADLVKEMREAKRKAIEARVEQLRDLFMQHQERGEEESDTPMQGSSRQGFFAKLVRKIVSNVHVSVQVARCAYSSPAAGLGLSLELQGLDVVSTNASFQERGGEAQDAGLAPPEDDGSLYKLLRLNQLGLRMSPAGNAELADARHVLHPVSASLRLAHEPAKGVLTTQFELARENLLELTLLRSQVKHLRSGQAKSGKKAARLYRLMVPPADEETIFQDVNVSMAEYGDLYERQLDFTESAEKTPASPAALERNPSLPLVPEERRRMRLLEDALSVRLLARRRLLVQERREALKEVDGQSRQQPLPDCCSAGWRQSLLRRLSAAWAVLAARRGLRQALRAAAVSEDEGRARGKGRAARKKGKGGASLWLDASERSRLLRDVGDDAKFTRVDVPQRMRFEFQLGMLALDLVDDRWPCEEERQLLSLALEDAHFTFDLRFNTDYHGRDSAAWSLEMRLRTFHAFHGGNTVFKFLGTSGKCMSPKKMRRPTTVNLAQKVPRLGNNNAARLLIASELGRDENVMQLLFDFAPTEVHLFQGIVEEIREFLRAPPAPADDEGEAAAPAADEVDEAADADAAAAAAFTMSVSDITVGSTEAEPPPAGPRLRRAVTNMVLGGREDAETVAEIVYKKIPKTMGSRERAQRVAKKVYERIPDKLRLGIVIASPTFFVPVPGQGTTMFSLGLLQIKTPQPCKYSSLTINLDLDDMVFYATTIRGEHFDMFQPVPLHVNIQYASDDEGSSVIVGVEAEKLALSLAPQALQMLMATPFAMAGIMWEKERPEDEVAKQEAEQPEAQVPDEGEPGEELPDADEEQPSSDAAPVKNRQFKFSLTLGIRALKLTLADSVVPVMVLRMQWLPPGLEIYRERVPHPWMSIDLLYTLEIEILNPRNNAWEPLIERFHGGLQLVRQSPQDETLTRIVVSGREQVLLNLKPTTLQRVVWFMPLFLKGLTFERELVVTSTDGTTSDVSSKYRVVNLSGEALQLEFTSCHHAGLVTRVEPTGSRWELLDKWVKAPYFATALVARLPGGRNSQTLSLEHNGAVVVPDCGLVAQLLTPSPSDRTQYRMLLLSSPVKVHNQTGLTLHVRFHAVDDDVCEVLAVSTPPTASCDGAFLGHFPPEDLVRFGGPSEFVEHMAPIGEGILVLPPNTVASVPSPALVREQGGDISLSRVWLTARPAGCNADFCEVVEAGANAETSSMRCPGKNDKSEDLYFVCRTCVQVEQLPNALPLATIALQAPLALLNALPAVEGLMVDCGRLQKSKRGTWRGKLQAVVPRLARVHLHGLPGVVSRDGIILRARLGPGGPWSAPVKMEAALFEAAAEDGAPAAQTLLLRQHLGGAPAGVAVEAVGPQQLRISCPYWFVDRSGLPPQLGLGLVLKGSPLPRSGGITMLHPHCLEEEVELAVGGAPVLGNGCCCTATGGVDHVTTRMPPNWSVFTLPSSLGHFVFCVQTEYVASSDVIGSTCQVMTLRPRLILTNTSKQDLEVQATEVEALPEVLPAGASRAWHRGFEGSDADPPQCQLRFRPVQDGKPLSKWSGLVVCSDAAAGSTPFLLAADGDSPGARPPLVWSAEVAPSRGALALSLREGSDFVAVNRASRARASMVVRPLGGDTAVDLPVPRGHAVAVGWPQPLKGDRARGVDVIINGSMRVQLPDVRRTMRRGVSGQRLVVAVARKGKCTEVALEDSEAHGQRKHEAVGTRSTLQLEFKLARLGLSLVEEVPQPRELLYLRLDLVRFEWQKKSDLDVQRIKLMISDAQVDCQLAGRAEAELQGGTQEGWGLLRREDRPAVLLANCADGDRPFLSLMLERGATSSRDLVLSQAEVALDALDVAVDDGWMEPLARFFSQCRSPGTNRGMTFHRVEELAGRPAVEGYEPPPLPSVIQVERLEISSVKMTLWCGLKLRSALSFLPPYLHTAVRVLSFSDELTLEDATLTLPERKVPPHRGSLMDFLRGLASEYTLNLVKNVGVVLGKSSLLNLPKVPIKIGSSAVSYLTEGMGLVAGEAASLLNQLTLDDEYVARQRRIRSEKHIRGVADGMAEAGRALGEGLEGVLDVVKKPAEGWRSHGLGGAVVGVGQGLASGVFKPISNIGMAVADIGSGISAQVAPESAGARRRRARPRSRRPRLLFRGAAVRPWSEAEAALLRQVGAGPLRGVEEVVVVERRPDRRLAVLLLFGDRLALARVDLPPGAADEGGDGRCASGAVAGVGHTGSASSGNSRGSGSNMGLGKAGAPNLLGALEESTSRILSQTLRPIKGLVHDVQDFGREWRAGGRDSEAHDGGASTFDPSLGVRTLLFSELRDVLLREDARGPSLELSLMGGVCVLPLTGAPLTEAVREGLVAGLQSAVLHADSQANWAQLRAALREEQRGRRERTGTVGDVPLSLASEAGCRTLEVYEVERWRFAAGNWQTPFLPSDRELSWRWIDATGKRHPHLRKQVTREQAGQLREPPCELDAMFQATCEWSIERGEGTDADGWRYGLAWRSSTWDVAPGIFDVLRRRKWLRTFT